MSESNTPSETEQTAIEQKAALFLDLYALNLSRWAQEKPDTAQQMLSRLMSTIASDIPPATNQPQEHDDD